MTSKDRLLKSFSHQEPDRIPIDMGTPVSSIHREAYVRLKDYLALNGGGFKVIDKMQQIVEIEEPVLDRFSVDTRQLHLKPATPWCKLPGGDYIDEWGIKYRDSGGGKYFDMYEYPLSEADADNLDQYAWPDPGHPKRIEGLSEQARILRQNTDFALILNGFGECLFGRPSWIRGHARFYMDIIENKRSLNRFLDKMLEYELKLAESALGAVGEYIDVVRVADDLGSERGLIISPHHYRELIKPRQEELYRFIKSNSRAKILLHSCGSVYDLIPDFIEIGVDALNPVQVSAEHMSTDKLKREFGRDITFWGGGCDSQKVLPFGSPEDVVEETMRRIGDLAPGGGFVLAPIHNIQYDVPPENICALYDTALEFGRYPISG